MIGRKRVWYTTLNGIVDTPTCILHQIINRASALLSGQMFFALYSVRPLDLQTLLVLSNSNQYPRFKELFWCITVEWNITWQKYYSRLNTLFSKVECIMKKQNSNIKIKNAQSTFIHKAFLQFGLSTFLWTMSMFNTYNIKPCNLFGHPCYRLSRIRAIQLCSSRAAVQEQG